MQMIVEFFSRICARTVRMPGKIDSPGVDIIAKILKGEG